MITHERHMPLAPETGLPYLILPVELRIRAPRDAEWNYHHHFYYKRDPNLTGGIYFTSDIYQNPQQLPLDKLAGWAVRVSRGQLLPVNVHDKAHREYGGGPKLPRTIDEKFSVAVKACAGIVSRTAIDLQKPAHRRFVRMDDHTFKKITDPKVLFTEKKYTLYQSDYRRRVLGSFFLGYAIEQDLQHVSPKVVDEFLSTKSRERAQELGNFLLEKGLEASINPLRSDYNVLRRKGLVQAGNSDILSSIKKTIHPNRIHMFMPRLRERLLVAA